MLTTGATTYDRTNYDLKINYAGPKLNVFGRYGNSPHLINDAYALGEAGGGSAGGGQVGLAPGRTQVFGMGATYVFNSTTLLDANYGLTHQVLGAEAPDIDVNVGSDADKMNIPGTNGPDRMQGGLPSFQITNWSNLGNDNTGNPFNFRDNQYAFSANLQKNARRAPLPRGTRVPRPADQPLPAAGRCVPDGARHVPVQRAGHDAPGRSRARGREVQLVGRVPARAAVGCRQGRSARQSELDLHEDVLGVRAGHVAASMGR